VKKLGPFEEFGSSNLGTGLSKKYRDNKDLEKELKKESKKERLSISAITSSQFLFKVDIKHYQGKIDVVKLNRWLQQL
jgi:hypothetical protein